ncbi:MAG: MauE/DoxX family redox-associated membrane protein [Acidobacteriota bacterium]
MSDSSPPIPPWRHRLSLAGSIFLGAIFLVAAWAKTLNPGSLADQITREGLDFLLPAGVVALIALALEYFLGSALVLGLRRRVVLWPTAALVVFFLFLTGRTYVRSLQGIEPEDASCGCFGNLVQRTPAEAFWQDLFLMVPALLLAFLALRGGLPRVRTAIAVAVTLAMTLLAWRAPHLPLDDVATSLKPGVDIASLCIEGSSGSDVCLDGIVPELSEGEHVVVLTELDDELIAHVDDLNDFYWTAEAPALWVLTGASEEELFQFRFTQGPTFELREAPKPLLQRMWRQAPRSFEVSDGEVTRTWSGLPPLDALRSAESQDSAAVPSATTR